MGSLFSILKLTWKTFAETAMAYHQLAQKIQSSPGLPVVSPTESYWMKPPVEVPTEKEWADEADIVILGSGITAVSVARELMNGYGSKETEGKRKKIVMVEARDVCSGATARCAHFSFP
jgi:hypothetical protein